MKQSVHCKRVAARIGRGGLDHDTSCISRNEEVSTRVENLFWHGLKLVDAKEFKPEIIKELQLVDIHGKELDWLKNVDIEKLLMRLRISVKPDPWSIHKIIDDLVRERPDDEPEVYFYHSDHLGGASWITDHDGNPVQHLQYLPYGEPYVDQRTIGYSERFRFTGKERDEETGYGYFGAKYMDHELMTMWLSVDPMADKYPSVSPYAYCAWNPVKLVDPDGREIDISGIFDQNGNAKKGCELACKAFLFFAKTSYGQKTLARFAKKGQTIAGHTYTEDGYYHNKGIDLGFRVGKLKNGSSASGETGYDITGSGNTSRMKLTIALCNPVVASDNDNIAGYLQTICHEIYFHAYNYAVDFIDDRTINDSEIRPYLKKGRDYTSRNMWHEVQDLRHNHAYRDNAIPIMSAFFGRTKSRTETIEWMSRQGLYFKHCKNWQKK